MIGIKWFLEHPSSVLCKLTISALRTKCGQLLAGSKSFWDKLRSVPSLLMLWNSIAIAENRSWP